VAPFRFSAPETRRNGAQIKDKLFKKSKTTKVIVFHLGEVEKMITNRCVVNVTGRLGDRPEGRERHISHDNNNVFCPSLIRFDNFFS
jgi:hypothetical protein